jgi:hypothetical protein
MKDRAEKVDLECDILYCAGLDGIRDKPAGRGERPKALTGLTGLKETDRNVEGVFCI